MLTYLDFDLLLERAGDGYRARVISCPAGEGTADFTLPFSPLELENFVLRVGQTRRGMRRLESPQMELARTFGSKLFNAVLTGVVQDCYNRSLDIAEEHDQGLRVRLRLADVPELADVPWEYLYDPKGDRFLSLSVETPIVRYLDLPERIRPLPVQPPLRVLAMIASPQDLPSLDIEREWANLQAALADHQAAGQIVLERLERPTLAALQDQLRKEEYHVFHFIGHGAFDETAQSGVLMLEDETGRARPVSGQDLGTLLHDERSLRLAVLNACEGARTSKTDPFAGTAHSLVKQGIPAVIAMQFEISDDAAITFTRNFYGALADGYPVDAALAEARKAIFARDNDVEWGTPVLYLRAPDGRVFDVQPPAPALGPVSDRAPSPPLGPVSDRATPPPASTGRRPPWLPAALVAAVLLLFGGGYLGLRGILAPANPPTSTPTREMVTPIGLSQRTLITPMPPLIETERTLPPTATRTPTRPPTHTPTPSATSTRTPRPATPTATPCAGIDALLRSAFDLGIGQALDLGCPTARATTTDAAFQEFWLNPTSAATRVRSLMLWRRDLGQIYLVDGKGSQSSPAVWAAFADPWQEGQPDWPPACAAFKPPAGYRLPVRGFGKLWCDNRLYDRIGWPAEDERAAGLLSQTLQSGWLLRLTAADRTYFIAAETLTGRAVFTSSGAQ